MSTKKSADTSFRDLVARLNAMNNLTPEEERASLMEAAGKAPKVLDDKEVTLSDIAKLAGIKEYVEPVKVSKKAKKMVESITAEPKTESSITKAIKESDADTSLATNIKKEVNEEVKRLDKIAELETQLAELKAQEKEDATMDDKAFREVFTKEITEYVKEAEATDLVELYNKFSANEVDMNEDSFVIRTPETSEIIADAEKAEAPAEEQQVDEKVVDGVQTDRNTSEPHRKEKDDEDEAEDKSDDDTDGEVPMLDKDFDEGEEVELEVPAEDKFTNDLDPAQKK
jgi:hypothetical protein|tara:strand:+ start:279 stop:1133 length:855 start_codon:yes stop_codon:yes gene_type:complete